MSDLYQIRWLGHLKEENHDKIWGYLITRDKRVFAFWGRRAKTVRFKQHANMLEAEALIHNKEKKGYKYVRPEYYDILVPGFLDELELNFMTATLSETIMPA